MNDDVKVVTQRGRVPLSGDENASGESGRRLGAGATKTPTVTLITCYPSFVGHAPQRFIVQAERIEADPLPV